jgi:hypothetical protein
MNIQTGTKRELTSFFVGNAIAVISLVVIARSVLL